MTATKESTAKDSAASARAQKGSAKAKDKGDEFVRPDEDAAAAQSRLARERLEHKHEVADTGDVYAAPRLAPERPAAVVDNGREVWPSVGSAYSPIAPLATEVSRSEGGGLGGSAGPGNGLGSLEAVTGVTTGTLPESPVNKDTVKVPVGESTVLTVDTRDNQVNVSDIPPSARDTTEIRDPHKEHVVEQTAVVPEKATVVAD